MPIFKDEAEKVVAQEMTAAIQNGETLNEFVAGLDKADQDLVYEIAMRIVRITRATRAK